MKESKRDILRSLAGIVVSTGLTFATHDTGIFALTILHGITGSMAGGFFQEIYNKISKLLEAPHPSELDQDIIKLVVKATEWSIMNIEVLYKQNLISDDHKTQLSIFTEHILKEIKELHESISMDGGGLYKMVEYESNPKIILKTFNLKVSEFPVIDPENPFNKFFQNQFKQNFKLCFGKLLNDEKNKPALVSYQRDVYQSLDQGIQKVIEKNNKILKKLDHKEPYVKQNKELRRLIGRLKSLPRDKVNPIFMASINQQLETMSGKTKLLVQQSELILEEVNKIKIITTVFRKDLKASWLEKNKAYVIAGSGIVTIIILGLAYYLYSQPFQMVLHLEKNKSLPIHPDYPDPRRESMLRVYLPNQVREKELTKSNEIILNELNASNTGFFCKAELLDPYWKLTLDSLQLKSGNFPIEIEPNNALALVEGRVLSRDGEYKIENAVVWVETQRTSTDSSGRFSVKVPIGNRKPSYLVRIEKQGYPTSERIYYPGSAIDIRLENP